MAMPGGGGSGEEPKAIGPRLLKIAIALGAVAIVYSVFSDMLGNVFSGARRSKLDGDFSELTKIIQRAELETKKRFEDHDLDKLPGLAGSVRDPDGRPYLYDFFFRRLIYTGPDGLLQTVVPGKTVEAGENDDEIRSLAAFDRLVYARKEGDQSAIDLANADGSGVRTLATVPAEVLGVRGLGVQDANLVTLTQKTATGSQIAILDVAEPTPAVTPISKGDQLDCWPVPFGAKTEWVFYQSAEPAKPDRTNVYKMSYKEKLPAKMTSGDAAFGQPSVEVKAHWIWYAGGGTLWRAQLSSFGEPQKRLAQAGRDLRCPSASAAGDHLAYLAVAGGKTTLEVIEVSSGKLVFSTADVLPDSGIAWSPDDLKIGYLTRQDDGLKMVLTHVSKKVSLVLPQPVIGCSFAWLHD